MKTSLLNYPTSYLKYDLTAGIVVFLVAIPLCLGIALASGAPLFSGLISGIIGGIIVGILSESEVSVSGPAAGMVAVVLAAIAKLGGFEPFLLALLLAGVLQIAIGALRAGFIADYIPSNVIHGLLCAIGILIIIKQIPFAFTYTAESASLLKALRLTSEGIEWLPLESIADSLNFGAAFISLASLAMLIFFDMTKNRHLKSLPGPIIVVIFGVLVNECFYWFWPEFTQFSEELVNIPVSNDFFQFLSFFSHPDWKAWSNPDIYGYAILLAAVASLETLLNLEAIEKLDNVRRYVSRNRELVAQGIGNITAGLTGGLPVTSVIVRSSVNIQAGSKSRLSAIVHGMLILVVVLMVPHWVNLIPLASLAAILIHVGYKLTKPTLYKKMYRQGWARFIPFIITVIAILASNLLTGILIGLFFSFFFILRENSRIQIDIINEKHPAGTVHRLILPQQLYFLSKASLVAELDSMPANSQMIIDARHTKYIDQDIMEIIETFHKLQAPSKNIALNLAGFRNHYEIHNHLEFVNVTTYDTQHSLKPSEVLEILQEGNHRFANDQLIHRSLSDEIRATSFTQHPVAIVLGCIDSRVPVETIFDMGLGGVFVVRIAGNVINDDIIASMEFATAIAGARLIVVLGHTGCGAIKAACNNGTSGHLKQLLDKIKPAIAAETGTPDNPDFLTNVTKINVRNMVHLIYQTSPVLRELIDKGDIGLTGALYDIQTGKVEFGKLSDVMKN